MMILDVNRFKLEIVNVGKWILLGGESYGATVIQYHRCTQPLDPIGSIHPRGSNDWM